MQTPPAVTTSRFSDDVVPHLSERDARSLATSITECLLALGERPTRFGVTLDHDGFWFVATLNGRDVSARYGQGNFAYSQIAEDLVLASTDAGWDALTPMKG